MFIETREKHNHTNKKSSPNRIASPKAIELQVKHYFSVQHSCTAWLAPHFYNLCHRTELQILKKFTRLRHLLTEHDEARHTPQAKDKQLIDFDSVKELSAFLKSVDNNTVMRRVIEMGRLHTPLSLLVAKFMSDNVGKLYFLFTVATITTNECYIRPQNIARILKKADTVLEHKTFAHWRDKLALIQAAKSALEPFVETHYSAQQTEIRMTLTTRRQRANTSPLSSATNSESRPSPLATPPHSNKP